MADETTPNRASNTEQAEGDRSIAESKYDRTNKERASGITNRPLEEELANQEAVPDRGHRKDEER